MGQERHVYVFRWNIIVSITLRRTIIAISGERGFPSDKFIWEIAQSDCTWVREIQTWSNTATVTAWSVRIFTKQPIRPIYAWLMQIIEKGLQCAWKVSSRNNNNLQQIIPQRIYHLQTVHERPMRFVWSFKHLRYTLECKLINLTPRMTP